jgi:hypothetical protein
MQNAHFGVILTPNNPEKHRKMAVLRLFCANNANLSIGNLAICHYKKKKKKKQVWPRAAHCQWNVARKQALGTAGVECAQ